MVSPTNAPRLPISFLSSRVSRPGLTAGLLACTLGLGAVLLPACTPPQNDTAITQPGEGEIVTLFVGPEVVPCVGVSPQGCLQVRESLNDEYSHFYSPIEGFDFEPGYIYELLVQKTPVDNPPADASSIRWTLIEVVEKAPAP